MKVKVATSQFKAVKGDFDANLNKALNLVEKASKESVDILLLQELFQDHYFCSTKNDKFFNLAIEFPSNPMFEKLFPDRDIIMLETANINYGGGNIHCITMNVPKI